MKANPNKWHLFSIKNEIVEANINENNISNTKFEKLLGVTFDNRFIFNYHISNIWKTFCNKHPVSIYIFKVNNRNTRTRCDISSKLTIKTPERHHWRRSSVFIVNFDCISHLVLVFLLLTLRRSMLTGKHTLNSLKLHGSR